MKKSRKTVVKLLIGGILLLAVLGITIGGIHAHKSHRLKVEAKDRDSIFKAGPVVKAFLVKNAAGGTDLSLIGEARPYESATLYAQISGYLQNIYIDKGDHVVAGQVLAIIDNPQIDEQYNAARSDLINKQRILERDNELLKKQYISQEEYDQALTNVETAQSTLNSLGEQQAYKQLKAPFTGTITDRYVDPGAMIQNAGGSQSGSQPIVTIATLEKLRVYVYVAQKDAAFLRNGYPVEIYNSQDPEKRIKGAITRYAGSLDTHTRMMLVEIDVDNSGHVLIPGSYVTVHIAGPKDNAMKVQIPSNGLVVHNDKTMVALIDKDTTIRFRPVTIGFNNGDSVTLISGLHAGETIALQVGEYFAEGQKVRILKDSADNKGGNKGQSQGQGAGRDKDRYGQGEHLGGQGGDKGKPNGQGQGGNKKMSKKDEKKMKASQKKEDRQNGM
jgi:RND family efflux transporter MFP subunit